MAAIICLTALSLFETNTVLQILNITQWVEVDLCKTTNISHNTALHGFLNGLKINTFLLLIRNSSL